MSNSNTLLGVWLFFHPDEMSPLDECVVKGQNNPLRSVSGNKNVPYISYGKEIQEGVEYDVVQCSFYYKDNPATGIGFRVDPKNKKLGYHPDDVEFVSIYYLENKPVKVFASAHSTRNGYGNWIDFEKAPKKDGYLMIYVSQNSHANYFTKGIQPRIFGFANDNTSSSGINKKYAFDEMERSFEWNNGKGIYLCFGLRPAPPSVSKTTLERFLQTK